MLGPFYLFNDLLYDLGNRKRLGNFNNGKLLKLLSQ